MYEKFRVVAFVEELTLIQYQSVKKYESNCFQYLHPHPPKIPQTRWRVDCKKGLRKQNDPFGETTMEWKWNMETVRLLRFTYSPKYPFKVRVTGRRCKSLLSD